MEELLRDEIPPGTLHLLVLKTLARGPNHGYGIAQFVKARITRCFACRGRIAVSGAAAYVAERLGESRVARDREQAARPRLFAY